MANVHNAIYIGTIALEKNRWKPGREPTYQVSEWLDRFVEAGFDGMELWEYHATLATEEERRRLEQSPLPVAIYNTYADFDDAGAADRRRAAELAERFGAAGFKFNLGGDAELWDTYIRNADRWRETLPADSRVLCECHPGTVVEEPDRAAAAFDAWGPGRFGAMAHAFSIPAERLRAWLERLGPTVQHVHVQCRDADRQFHRLDDQPARAKEVLGVLRDGGFSGSFTLEFTAGASAPDENIDALWTNVLADLAFLREHLS